MNPIDAKFAELKAAGRKAFLPFLAAGDPDLPFTAEALQTLAANGADLIELGFPFSDPVADGPVIQASYTRALKAKFRIGELFETVKPLKTPPLLAMASYSLIWKRGPEAFLKQAQASGLSGAVVPDLPAEEAELISELGRDNDFKIVLLVTPTTDPKRMENIVRHCSGFVYVVSLVGITGERAAVADVVRDVTTRLRKVTDLPLCVGFGISKPDHVRDLREHCDGLIVGSAFVKHLEAASNPAERPAALKRIAELAKELAGAVNPKS